MPGGNPGIPEAESGNFIWSRRDLLSLAGWGAILTCFAAAGVAILRLLFPRVLFEPPTSFKAGLPTEYTVGDVSEKWMKSQRVWIVPLPRLGLHQGRRQLRGPHAASAGAREDHAGRRRPAGRRQGLPLPVRARP